MKSARCISAVFLAAVTLTACSDGPDRPKHNDVPHGWIIREYEPATTGYLDKADPVSTVASEIDGHTSARKRTDNDGTVYLMYRDDIVAISPQQGSTGGSLIEVVDYSVGYTRWNSHLALVWPHPASNEFRGGGPGSGK
ncbi:DUF4247 domain-containing protein [Streptomyces sp. NPDC005963]|uniref:DUF4247 domain-containing protein n=1 Tax=Streptomyces sp. NPDC005963 TaxID=3156721 RepID=UPI0033CFEC39